MKTISTRGSIRRGTAILSFGAILYAVTWLLHPTLVLWNVGQIASCIFVFIGLWLLLKAVSARLSGETIPVPSKALASKIDQVAIDHNGNAIEVTCD